MIQAHKQHLFFTSMQSGVRQVLDGMGVMVKMRPGHLFSLRVDALRQAAYVAGSSHPDDRPPGMQTALAAAAYSSEWSPGADKLAGPDEQGKVPLDKHHDQLSHSFSKEYSVNNLLKLACFFSVLTSFQSVIKKFSLSLSLG